MKAEKKGEELLYGEGKMTEGAPKVMNEPDIKAWIAKKYGHLAWIITKEDEKIVNQFAKEYAENISLSDKLSECGFVKNDDGYDVWSKGNLSFDFDRLVVYYKSKKILDLYG